MVRPGGRIEQPSPQQGECGRGWRRERQAPDLVETIPAEFVELAISGQWGIGAAGESIAFDDQEPGVEADRPVRRRDRAAEIAQAVERWRTPQRQAGLLPQLPRRGDRRAAASAGSAARRICACVNGASAVATGALKSAASTAPPGKTWHSGMKRAVTLRRPIRTRGAGGRLSSTISVTASRAWTGAGTMVRTCVLAPVEPPAQALPQTVAWLVRGGGCVTG